MNHSYDPIVEMTTAVNLLESYLRAIDLPEYLKKEVKKISKQIRPLLEDGSIIGYSIFADQIGDLAKLFSKEGYETDTADRAFTHAMRIQKQELKNLR